MNNFAIMLIKLGRHADAQLLLQKAVDEMELRLPPRHPEYYFALCSLATSYYIKGQNGRGDSTIAKCEAYADESLPSTLRSGLDAAHVAMSTQKDTLKFKDVSQLAYTQDISNETQLSIQPLESYRHESSPALKKLSSVFNLRELGERTTGRDSQGRWHQWMFMKKKILVNKSAVFPESQENILNERGYNSGSKGRRAVRWAPRISRTEQLVHLFAARPSSMVVEVGDGSDEMHPSEYDEIHPSECDETHPSEDGETRPSKYDDKGDKVHPFELPVGPVISELPTEYHICSADLMDRREKTVAPNPNLPLPADLSPSAGHRHILTDDLPVAKRIVASYSPQDRSPKASDIELGIETPFVASQSPDRDGSAALRQWVKTVAESRIINQELEEHWLEAQSLPDRMQLSAANLEKGFVEPRNLLSDISESKSDAGYAMSVSSSTLIRSPEAIHGAAVGPVKAEITLSPISDSEGRMLTDIISSPSVNRSYKAKNRSSRFRLEHAQSIYSSISRPPPTDRSSGIIPNRLMKAEILTRSGTGALVFSHEIDILLDTGSTDLDVVSTDYCECWGHPILPAPAKLRRTYLDAMGYRVSIQGVAKICLRWHGRTGTVTKLREFAVVEDYPQDMSLGNRTITRYDLLRGGPGLMLPFLLATRPREAKGRDREQTRRAKETAKREEAQYLEERLKKWHATPNSPLGSSSLSSNSISSPGTASSTTTSSPSGGRSQDGSQCTSLTSDLQPPAPEPLENVVQTDKNIDRFGGSDSTHFKGVYGWI